MSLRSKLSRPLSASLREKIQHWIFRVPQAESSPIILTQRRIYIIPSKNGLLFAIVLIVMWLGAINYDLSLGHALVFLLASLGLVGMVHTFRNLISLRLIIGRPAAVFAGELAHFPICLENTKKQARRAITLAFGKHENTRVDIAAHDKTTSSIAYPALQRGWLKPGRITLSTRYPLGLFYAWSYPNPALNCLVYPAPIDTPLPSISATASQGQAQGQSGQEDFSGLRHWHSNDSPRHIAWKAVARDIEQRPLLVKQFSGGAASELILDWDLIHVEHNLETRLSILTGWVLAAEQAQQPYGLRLPRLSIAPALGHTHRETCLEALALYV